ncbi:MAG: hypothetical protein HUU10_11045 [Bacteroidetes bacterium]|nr:hypothetical protein [Bacteroidota bacterium]
MKTIFILLALGFATIQYPVGGKTGSISQQPVQANWLIGTWGIQTKKGRMYEQWMLSPDSSLSGRSYYLKNGDTLVFETMQIISIRDTIFYVPTIFNQNQGKPVRFYSTHLSDTLMTFENPAHDFPQRIAYRRIAADSIVATISGEAGGQLRKQSYPMAREK